MSLAIRRALPTTGGAVTTPPFHLIAAHFAAALVWMLIGAGLLVWLAPALANGGVFEPRVFALVHVFTIGVVATSIFGTLHQFVPGGLGVPLRSIRLAYWSFGMMQAGVACLTAGFFVWRGALQGLGWLLVLTGVYAVSRNVLRARRLSVHGKTVGLFITVAHASLGAGLLVAGARLGETIGWWHVNRMYLLATHLLFGLAGFGTLSVTGVGSRMLPTFLNAGGDDSAWLRVQLTATVAGQLTFAGGAIGNAAWLRMLGGFTLLVAGVMTVALGSRWFRRRARAMDAPLWHVASAFLALTSSLLIGSLLLFGNGFAFQRWIALVSALVLGWLTTLIVGVAAKILPHMSYMRLAPMMPGFRALGSPNRLLNDRWQLGGALLLTIGWSGISVSALLGDEQWLRAAALTWSGGVLLTALNYAQMYVHGRWPALNPEAIPVAG